MSLTVWANDEWYTLLHCQIRNSGFKDCVFLTTLLHFLEKMWLQFKFVEQREKRDIWWRLLTLSHWKFTLSNGKLCPVYRTQVFYFFYFTCSASMDEPLRWTREAPKHVEWEPTHSTGLSLELNLRLPCLCKFQVCLSVRRIEKEEEK